MKLHICFWDKSALQRLFVLTCLFVSTPELSAQDTTATSLGLQITSDSHSSFGLFKRRRAAVYSIDGYYPGSISTYFDVIVQEVQIESLDDFVMIRQLVLDEDLVAPVALTLDRYISILYERHMKNYWQDYSVEHFAAIETQHGPGGINLEIPVRIKSRAFQKIFGSGTVGLVVTGDISIKAGLRREDRSETRDAITRGSNTNFKMEQKQRFSVTGRIGDKVKINVDQDSERAFDFDNNVRLVYEGYDDEIVRKFEAGNISLSLPGTRYVTFSGKSSGLFGLKTEMTFGNLNFTAIASQEKGESKKLSYSGGATADDAGQSIEDYRYLKDQYFFLDKNYWYNYRYYNDSGIHIASRDPATGELNGIKPDRIEVYIAKPGNHTLDADKVIQGRATLTGVVDDENFGVVAGSSAEGQFVRLEKTEYEMLNNDLGYIRLNSPLSADEILAVAYETQQDSIFGDLDFVRGGTDTTIALKLIRDKSPSPSHATWDLSWKHVYSLGSQNIPEEGLEIKILSKPTSGALPSPINDDQKSDTFGANWLGIFGLDKTNEAGAPQTDDKFDTGDDTILNRARGELYFRDLRPFDPVGYFTIDNYPNSHQALTLAVADNSLDSTRRVGAIYKETDPNKISRASKFQINVKTQNRQTQIQLGFNVIEGSEVVELDNQILQKGLDYNIDYFSGQLDILDPRASNPSAKLDITYERNQLFQLEKKTILGMRAEYDLGENSFLGGTLLYLNESTLDRKVRVGRGPKQNMVWDINGRLNFKPNFIGRGIDAIPVVTSQGETTLNFEGEIAQVIPTPNTLNSEATGDRKGVAYIDDFEAAKKSVNLGVLRRNWALASQPADGLHTFRNRMDNFVWFNPYNQVLLSEIYENFDDETRNISQNQTHILQFSLIDNPNLPADSTHTWAGVMRALSAGFYNQSETKFIEIVVQGEVGRMHIDLGTISEDVIPNGVLDTEDRRVNSIRNGLLDPGEDIGIDGVEKPDPETWNFPRDEFVGQRLDQVPYDFWDVDRDSVKDADEPWSYDDWFYDSNDPELRYTYIREGFGSINGTEGSETDGARVPDTEDINNNGILDRVNQYFSFSFSLDPNHPDFDKYAEISHSSPRNVAVAGPWKVYKIPFNPDNADSVYGSPQTDLIENMRIWFDEVDGKNAIVSIAEINLIGSEWKEVGIADNEYELTNLIPATDIGETFAITTINNHENTEYAVSLDDINVRGEVDPITDQEAREQSLVLTAVGLQANTAGLAEKSLFQGENYIHYDRIKMFVYGDNAAGTHIGADTTDIEYFIRFGVNEDNYYEYRSPVYQGWDAALQRNEMNVALLDFTSIGRATVADSAQADTSIGGVYYDSVNDIFIRRLEKNKRIVVKGNPSFTNVRLLTLGIRNNHPTGQPFTGRVYFNELRLSDVEQERGIAMRVKGDLRIGTFGSINMEIERKDADFHNVAERFGTGNNSVDRSLNTSVNVEQLLPQQLGLAIPFSFNSRRGSSYPKHFPGLDREVTNSDLDSILIRDRIQTVSEQTGFNISLSRREKSKNFFIKNTIDGMHFSLGHSKTTQRSPTIARSENVNWTGSFDYRLDFGKANYFSPLKWLPNLPLIKNAKETKLYFTPQNISIKTTANKTETVNANRIQSTGEAAVATSTDRFVYDRSLRTNMKIFDNLTLDFNRLHQAQLPQGQNLTAADFLKTDYDTRVNQSFTARYSPEIFSWLPANADFNSDYHYTDNIQNRETGRSTNNRTSIKTSATFKWKDLVNSIFSSKSHKNTPRPQRGPRGGNRQLTVFQEKKADGISLNPLKLARGFFSSFKDVRFDYSRTRDHTQIGLDSLHTPSWKYQFGLDDTTGFNSVSTLSGQPVSISRSNNFSISSGLDLARFIDIQLRFQRDNSISSSTQTKESRSSSYLWGFGFDTPFPTWNIRLTGLGKLPLLNKIFKSVSFSHAYNGTQDQSWDGVERREVSKTKTSGFRPFGKIDLSFKNGFTGNIGLNKSVTLNQSLAVGNGATQTSNSDLSITASYSKRSGFSLPFWPFNKAKLKNSVDFSFSFTASSALTETTQNYKVEPFQETHKTTRWSVSPRLTYSFSTTVRGGAFLEIGQVKSKLQGTTKTQEFGIDVNIAIRGN